MNEQQSFDGLAPSRPTAQTRSAGRRRTMMAKSAIAGGIHPLTRHLLLITGETCGACQHQIDRGRYFKCDRIEETRGPATDLRKSWPACDLFEGRGAS